MIVTYAIGTLIGSLLGTTGGDLTKPRVATSRRLGSPHERDSTGLRETGGCCDGGDERARRQSGDSRGEPTTSAPANIVFLMVDELRFPALPGWHHEFARVPGPIHAQRRCPVGPRVKFSNHYTAATPAVRPAQRW